MLYRGASLLEEFRGYKSFENGRYMHYFVRLEEGPPPANYYDTEKFNPKEMLERWIAEHRQKTIPLGP